MKTLFCQETPLNPLKPIGRDPTVVQLEAPCTKTSDDDRIPPLPVATNPPATK